LDNLAPTLAAFFKVLKRCPLFPRAFGRASDESSVKRRRELKEALEQFVAQDRHRDVATGWRVRTRLVATLASPLIYAVALHQSFDDSQHVVPDGYDAEDYGACYDAVQKCVSNILKRRGDTDGAAALVQAVAEGQCLEILASRRKRWRIRPLGATSSSLMSQSVRAMCAAARRLLQRHAARFMRTAANRRCAFVSVALRSPAHTCALLLILALAAHTASQAAVGGVPRGPDVCFACGVSAERSSGR
jgi:hypothetical protein